MQPPSDSRSRSLDPNPAGATTTRVAHEVFEVSSAEDYVLSPPAKQAAEGPAIVAEMTTEVANLSDP